MIKKKSFFSICLIFLFILSSVSVPTLKNSVNAVTTISAPKVEVTPNVIKQNAEYKITFTINQSISIGDSIYIVFPSDTLIPCSTCNPYIAAGNFTVNNIVPTQDVVGNTGARTLWIKSPVAVPANGTVIVVIKKGARILNPTKPGNYQLQVATSSESYYVLSEPYEIDYSKVSIPTVQLGTSTVGAQSAYTISFSTGVLGTLKEGMDSIFINFPKGTQFPETVYTDRATLNGSTGNFRLKIKGTTVEIDVLKEINAEEPITIEFSYSFGIKNPSIPGQYKIDVWTTKETTRVSSSYTITDKPEVHTSLISTPSVPDGSNGWFITQPIVVLVGLSNVAGSVQVFYSIDSKDKFVLYTTPFTISDGIHTLYYYSTNLAANLQEEVKEKKFMVNTQMPLLKINLKDGDILNSVNFDLVGSVVSSSSVNLLLNKKQIKVDKDGNFEEKLALNEGNNSLHFSLSDEAGHKVDKAISVYVDSVPPKLTVSSPSNWEEVNEKEIEVKGQTETDSDLTINGHSVQLNADGTFDYVLDIQQKGVYLINVISKDKAGNASVVSIPVIYKPLETIQIVLQIGSSQALINGTPKELDAPPFIDPKTNRTLVPLRFIAEAFKAKVSWDGSMKMVTVVKGNEKIILQVGNMMAVVNGTTIKMDQPPVIVNGRTMVPIRFISESLGAQVKWVPENGTIVITYKAAP